MEISSYAGADLNVGGANDPKYTVSVMFSGKKNIDVYQVMRNIREIHMCK